MKTFLNRPKRFGWKSVRKAAGKTDNPVVRASKSLKGFVAAVDAIPDAAERIGKRRTGMRVWAEKRSELEPLREHRVTGKGYLLAPCLVLWAAVWGTREAYDFAMANMALARAHDFKRL